MKYKFTLLLLLLALCSCKKDIDSIGFDLLGKDDDILNADFVEIPLEAYSMLEDSVYTKNLLNNVVGAIQDPVFGKTEAGFCTQFALTGNNAFFPADALLDSVVLTLQYYGYFGDTLSPLRFEVLELSSPLTADAYYSHQNQPDVTGSNLLLSSTSVYPKPTTPVSLDTVKTAAHIRLRLDGQLGERLMHLTSSQLANTTSFQEAFYGLCVRAHQPTRGAGNLCYVSLTSAMSGIVLYYKVNGVSKKYTFPISTDCVRYNFYSHDYASADADFRSQVISGNHSLGKQKLYLQSTAGVKTRVAMNGLYDVFKDSLQPGKYKRVIINRAELVLTNISTNEAYFFQPYNLSLQVVDGTTTTYTPDDATYTSSSYFGGAYDTETKEYRFRITNYIQELLKQKQNGLSDLGENLNVVVAGSGVRGNRLVFRGTDPDFADHFRLEVYYTEY